MASQLAGQHDSLVRKLTGLNGLDDGDVKALRALPIRERHLKAGTAIVAEN